MRRIFWWSAGWAAGVASSVSVMRRVRRQVDRMRPGRVGADVSRAVTAVGGELRSAVREGREAMRQREAQLWAELDPERPVRTPAEPRKGRR